MVHHTALKLLVSTALVSLLVGCGQEGPELAEVSGTVTLDGQSVPNALITFSPQEPEGSTSSGISNAEGEYSLGYSRDRMGAMIGKHNVTVATEKLSAEELAESQAQGITPPEFVELPAKYAVPGAISVEVTADDNVIPLVLTSE